MQLSSNNDNNRVFENFIRSFVEFKEATELTKPEKASKLASQIDLLSLSRQGLLFLYDKALELEAAGIFEGTAWNEPDKLVPSLVKGTLQFGHPSSSFEILSELRMLAYAKKEGNHSTKITPDDAFHFINNVLILNLEFALKEPSEESRTFMSERELKKAFNIFSFILSEIDLSLIHDQLVEEIKLICEQRPVVTRKVRELINLLYDELEISPDTESGKQLTFYINAIKHPTQASRDKQDIEKYTAFLEKASQKKLNEEAQEMAHYMESTGLVSRYHAPLLLHLLDHHPQLAPACMSLNKSGVIQWEEHKNNITALIRENISPGNSQCIYGLSRMINRNLFSRDPVKTALENLRRIKIHPHVEKRILKSIVNPNVNISALQYLMSATFRVLGQPLGVGQGNNPTCQSARGISMWSQHAPARLINLIITAATQNNLVFRFEGKELVSSELGKGLLDKLDYNLDAVSVVLVPHLDKIYFEMMNRASGRFEDPHKWVNPALYGQWIPVGFASAYDYLSNSILDYRGFIRILYASFHLEYNDNREIVYPNPVGIFITSAKGEMVGFHAVSLLRVARDPEGEMRAYFLNPNNEGRQDWGQGVQPSVYGKGEEQGESSLPFHQFAARIYAFHYNNLEAENRIDQVPEEEILRIEKMAKESWGKAYTWIQNPKSW